MKSLARLNEIGHSRNSVQGQGGSLQRVSLPDFCELSICPPKHVVMGVVWSDILLRSGDLSIQSLAECAISDILTFLFVKCAYGRAVIIVKHTVRLFRPNDTFA